MFFLLFFFLKIYLPPTENTFYLSKGFFITRPYKKATIKLAA